MKESVFVYECLKGLSTKIPKIGELGHRGNCGIEPDMYRALENENIFEGSRENDNYQNDPRKYDYDNNKSNRTNDFIEHNDVSRK